MSVDEAVDAVTRNHAGAGPRAHRRSPRRIGEQRIHVRRQRVGIAERRQQPDVRRVDHILDAAHVGAHAGHAGRHRFDQRDGRALVARRQQEHIGGAVDRRQVAAPAEKTHVAGDAQRGGVGFEIGSQLAVAGDQRDRVRMRGHDVLDHIQEEAMLLDRRQSSDRGHDGHASGQVEIAPRRFARSRVDGGKRRQVEAQRHDPVLRGHADVVAVEQFIPNRRRDRDDRIAGAGQHPLQRDEDLRHEGAEISLEHVAVVGVHHSRARRGSTRQVVKRRGQAPEQAGLGHVRVHDGRTHSRDLAVEPHERLVIVERRQRTTQCRE